MLLLGFCLQGMMEQYEIQDNADVFNFFFPVQNFIKRSSVSKWPDFDEATFINIHRPVNQQIIQYILSQELYHAYPFTIILCVSLKRQPSIYFLCCKDKWPVNTIRQSNCCLEPEMQAI